MHPPIQPPCLDRESTRRLGVPGLPYVPWGEHLCVFYRSKVELVDLVVPFIRAGLEDHEFCMWVTGGPIREGDAFRALEHVLPDVHRCLAARQLEIVPHTQWYLTNGRLDTDKILQNWASRADYSARRGFAGLRVTGNPFWLAHKIEWAAFDRYERQVQRTIAHQPMLALCTYPTASCDPAQMLTTLRHHGATLMPRGRAWKRVDLA